MTNPIDPLPTQIEGVDGAWLTAALRRGGRLGADESVTITSTQPVGADTAFAGTLHRLAIDGPAELPASIIVKLPVAGEVRPLLDGIGAYVREIAFYRDVAPQAPHRTPRVLLAEQRSDSTDFVLVLEDLAPLVSADQLRGLTLIEAKAVTSELARLHAWSWEQPWLSRYDDVFPPIDSPRGLAIQDQFAQFVSVGWPLVEATLGDHLSPSIRAFGSRLPELLGAFVNELASPRVLTHGELRSDNLFLDGDRPPIFIDFQATQQECGPRELAYLLSQSMPIAERRGRDEELVRRYWQGLVDEGVTGYPWERAWTQYRLAVAYSLYLPVVAFLRWDSTSETGRALLREMVLRAAAAIEDVDALRALPTRA